MTLKTLFPLRRGRTRLPGLQSEVCHQRVQLRDGEEPHPACGRGAWQQPSGRPGEQALPKLRHPGIEWDP